ncbi:MAG: hypothetical protein Kow00108_18440 [Calditrichia bacterium]
MESKNDLLLKLSAIRDTGEYNQADIEFIETCLDSEDPAIRAAAIITTDGCLYDMAIVDKIYQIAQEEEELPVLRSAIRQLGRFITACVMEGLDQSVPHERGLEFEEEFDELMEVQIEEKFTEIKDFLWNKAMMTDVHDPVAEDLFIALADLLSQQELKERYMELWQTADDTKKRAMFPAIERHPEDFEQVIEDVLVNQMDDEFVMEAIRIAAMVKSEAISNLVKTFLESHNAEIVSAALLTLAELNLDEELKEILEKYCLHETEAVQLSAKKALEIYSRHNFEDFMKDYF